MLKLGKEFFESIAFFHFLEAGKKQKTKKIKPKQRSITCRQKKSKKDNETNMYSLKRSIKLTNF